MIQVSIQTLLLSIHSLAKDRQAVGARLDAEEFGADELDELNDKTDQLTKALGELADLYEAQREGQQQVYPPTEQILALYD